MNSRYRFIEHAADLEFEAYGKTLGECFENAAQALFFSITDLSAVEPVERKAINIREDEADILLHEWLGELLYLFESEKMLFSTFKVRIGRKNGYSMKATSCGEKFNPEKHMINADVKAVTYHNLDVRKTKGRWVAHVVCDI